MSGHVQKSRIGIKRPTELPPLVLAAFIAAKNQIKEHGGHAGTARKAALFV